VSIADDRRQPLGLVAAFENRGAEVDVVEMQRAALGLNVDALHAPRLACLPRQIVLDMMRDRQPAEHRVAELMAAELPRRRHHPAHAELRAQFLRVPAGGGSRARPLPAAPRHRR
jgi:hypothetical protein